VRPQVYDSSPVSFDLVCADHDSPSCFPGNLDLVATDPLSSLRGDPSGYYALGKLSKDLVVLNTSNPAAPTVLKTVRCPWGTRDIGGETWHREDAYAFDDQFLYAALYRHNTWSQVYAFDLYSPDTTADFAIGDMNLGQFKSGSLASYGKYLYYFDKVRDDRDYHRLQVFEKARGCDPNLQVAIGPDPIGSDYEVGQNIRISWQCAGCPTRVDIKLLEDGIGSRTIASLKKFDQPNLAANHVLYPAQGISSDPDGHTYNIQILAWNIEGIYAETWSNGFRIVKVIDHGGKGPDPVVVDAILEGGKKGSYPLPGLTTTGESIRTDYYCVLPDNLEAAADTVVLDVKTDDGGASTIYKMDLIAIDDAHGCEVLLGSGEPVLKGDGNDIVPLLPLLHREAGSSPTGALSALQSIGIAQGDSVVIRSGDRHAFTFSLPRKEGNTVRHYVLRYQGTFVGSGSANGAIPTVFALKAPYPNPFNPSTVIGFDVPRQAVLAVTVYDAAGRRIRELQKGRCEPGTYRVVWDGRDSHGRPVSAGVYFCRLTIDHGKSMTKKLVMLK
jgi:hypothetical protein